MHKPKHFLVHAEHAPPYNSRNGSSHWRDGVDPVKVGAAAARWLQSKMMNPEAVASSRQSNDEDDLDADEWRDEMKAMLDGVEKKGEFCVGKDITGAVPRFQPSITIDGLDGDEPLAFPLPSSQAQLLRSVAEKAPFGKGTDTVLDETVRKAWQIDASKVRFGDSHQWQIVLQRIVADCVASLGMSGVQGASVRANLYKLLLYEPGGFFKKHRDTEKEPGMFGTLIIQLPSKFTGGSLVVEHSGEKRQYDFSAKSREGLFATAFYADCEHELLPVESGWRLCLAYNLVIPRHSSSAPLPTATVLTSQQRRMQRLTSDWTTHYGHPFGYVLEHNYTETNLHFSNLKGRDKEVVDFLRGSRGADGNPLFVVCLMLMEKHESGEPESSGCYGYRRGYDSDGGDHTMGEVYETEIGVKNWIGPDDQKMNGFRLDFDIDEQLLADEDSEGIFGEDPTSQDYESYTGNAGPTLDYWYHVGAVVFWPISMNMEVMKSAGDSYVASYLNVALPSEIVELGSYIVNQLEARKLKISPTILTGLCKTKDVELVLKALKCCPAMDSSALAKIIAKLPTQFQSEQLNAEILQIAKRTAASKKQCSYSPSTLPYTLEFLEALGSGPIFEAAQENVVMGATENFQGAATSSSISLLCKHALHCKSTDVFKSFCNAVKANPSALPAVLKSLVSLNAVSNPHVIELGGIRAKVLKEKTAGGEPPFSWSMSGATFPGSQGAEVTRFLRGNTQSQTFYGFNGIGHARNWASKYFSYGGLRGGYSAQASADGRGGGAYVTVTKNRGLHDALVAQYKKDQVELAGLAKDFGGRLDTGIADDAAVGNYESDGDDETAPSFSQPNAMFHGSNAEQVNAFLRGEEESRTFYHFNDIGHAQNWAYKYFGGHGQGTGYSARAVAGCNSSGACVTVTKTPLDGPPSKRLREY